MLKWTVKKRFAADQQNIENIGEEVVENIRKMNNRRSLGTMMTKKSCAKSPKHLQRRSLGSHLNSNRDKVDKENHFATPTRRKSTRQSSTPLADSSNFQSQNCAKRKHHLISSATMNSPTMSPISLNIKEIFVEPSATIFPSSYAPTLPTFDVEYSPVMKGTNRLDFDEIPSKRLKMDLMDISYEFKPESAATSSPLSTPLVSRKFSNGFKVPLELSDDSDLSMNSSDVGDTTLQKMIDDILQSARNGKKFKKCCPLTTNKRDKNANFMTTLSEACENMEQKSIERLLSPTKIAEAADQTIIIDQENTKNEREIRSPIVKRDVEIVDLKVDETCQLKRQNAVRRKNTSNENKNKRKPEETQKSDKEFQDSTIQKCLSFSSANFDDLSDKFKRSSVASNSSSSSNSYVSQSKYSKNHLMKGSLEIAISTEENRQKIIIHVIKCKNLFKTDDMPQINAYVKCALVSLNHPNQQNIYQRTAVHKNSSEPNFDHKFIFNINEPEDQSKYLQLAVWHRNRSIKRSEFIGCLTVAVQTILEKDFGGAFMLQPQSCLSKPSPLVHEIDEKISKFEETFQQIQEGKDDNLVLKYLDLNDFKDFQNAVSRTPFTLTTTINKQPEDVFGFEISWTKPPKVNSVKNLAQCSGLQKGDHIIFVGETNIVTMPKEEVIEMIRKHESSLTLEIFRPVEKVNSREIIERLALQLTPVVAKQSVNLSLDKLKKNVNELTETPKSRKSCNFKQPKICFQPTIGNGVIV